MSTGSNTYFSTYNTIRNIFDKAIEEVFTNEFSRNEIEFHSFHFVKNGKNITKDVYFDQTRLEVIDPLMDNEHFMNAYLDQTLFKDRCRISKETNVFMESDLYHRIYWIFFCECLDNNHSRLFLNRLFQQLALVFNQYIAGKRVFREEFLEREITEIVCAAENDADKYLNLMFVPFIRYFIDDIAGQYYEKSECCSNMAFFSNDAAMEISKKEFIYPFSDIDFIPSNSRLIRKLLQTAQDDLYLVLCKSNTATKFKVAGLCSEAQITELNPDSHAITVPYIKVNIKRHMQWDMFLNNIHIISSRNGHYKIERSLSDLRDYLLVDIMKYFNLNDTECNTLADNIIRSTEQRHGTMLVITDSDDAKNLAEDFAKQKYAFVNPVPQEQSAHINQLNAIDGCVLMDTQGKIYGIGTILDGLMDDAIGNLAKGARWNSAIKYGAKLQREGVKAMILIVSEDGHVNVKHVDA